MLLFHRKQDMGQLTHTLPAPFNMHIEGKCGEKPTLFLASQGDPCVKIKKIKILPGLGFTFYITDFVIETPLILYHRF